MHTSSTIDQHDHDAPHPGYQALMLRELRGRSATSRFDAFASRMALVALRRTLLWSEDDDVNDRFLAESWARVWAQHVSTALPFPGTPAEIHRALSGVLGESACRTWAAAVVAMAKAEWLALREELKAA